MLGDSLGFSRFTLFAFSLGGFAAPQRALVTPLLVLSLRNNGVHGQAASMPVYSDECQIGGRDLLPSVRNIVFNRNPYPHLHGRLEDAIHRGLQQDHVANMHRYEKVDVVHRSGYNIRVGMPMSS